MRPARLDDVPADWRRFAAFLAVGGLNTAVGYVLFAAGVLAGLDSFPALVIATVGGVLFNYQSIRRLVFAHQGDSRLGPFVGVYAVQFAVNLSGLRLLECAGVSALLAQAAMLPFLAVGGFLALRRFVFRG